MLQCMEISDLTTLLKESGDQLLDATTKLTLSNTLLTKINASLHEILNQNEEYQHEFHVSQHLSTLDDAKLDLVYLYDFIQKTLALKLLPDLTVNDNNSISIDIQLFKNLRLLEVHRLSSSLIRGLQYVRSQLEYITCIKQSVNTLGDILEECGADKQRGHIWNQLSSAIFSHNSIENIDGSLEFTPGLKSLDLSHNCIRNAYLLNCLPNLEILNLASNKLDTFPRFTGDICTQLKVLNLRNNFIEDIYDLSSLIRLEQLDLSCNCLLDHRLLLPLSNLPNLHSLSLERNPISYHKDHRKLTSSYLHINTTSNKFILDNIHLNNYEQRQIGAFIFLEPIQIIQNENIQTHIENNSPAHDSAISIMTNSTLSTNNFGRLDIIADVHRSDDLEDISKVSNTRRNINVDSEDSNDDMEANQSSSVQTVIEIIRDNVLLNEEQGMQDSGFEPGPGNCRMLASPCDSIELLACNPDPVLSHVSLNIPLNICPRSASSLNNLESKQAVIHCDSDIEILSNPSQSSIEVLSSTGPHNNSDTLISTPRSSVNTINKKLKKRRGGDAHRSL